MWNKREGQPSQFVRGNRDGVINWDWRKKEQNETANEVIQNKFHGRAVVEVSFPDLLDCSRSY